jgi:hypothetical protein
LTQALEYLRASAQIHVPDALSRIIVSWRVCYLRSCRPLQFIDDLFRRRSLYFARLPPIYALRFFSSWRCLASKQGTVQRHDICARDYMFSTHLDLLSAYLAPLRYLQVLVKTREVQRIHRLKNIGEVAIFNQSAR